MKKAGPFPGPAFRENYSFLSLFRFVGGGGDLFRY
jgi:hypothetical protein